MNDLVRDRFETFSVAGGKLERARQLAADRSGGPGARVVKRNREPASAGEASARRDRQDQGCPGELVEGSGRNDYNGPGPPLFMAGRRV